MIIPQEFHQQMRKLSPPHDERHFTYRISDLFNDIDPHKHVALHLFCMLPQIDLKLVAPYHGLLITMQDNSGIDERNPNWQP